MLRTKAEPQADGTYKLSGQKIFISAGEHNLAPNIVHLVLARLPDAPPGSKGISLFIVPKFNVAADGSMGERNGIYCGGLEHKMGIHGNATCQMVLDEAVGTLVGQPNKGLAAMFVMMNAARLGVGNQSLGPDRSGLPKCLGLCQRPRANALAHGRQSPRQTGRPDHRAPRCAPHAHDRQGLCRRWSRLACYCALLLDKELNHPDEAVRAEAAEVVALLTPIVKAFTTDNAWEATSACQQVFGGHGYIKEWGMEQYVRDARINMIYEGTNTIQSLDLLGRKVLGNQGATLKKFGKLVEQLVKAEMANEAMGEFIKPLADLGQKLTQLTGEVGMKAMSNADEVGAAAVDYLRVVGHLVLGYFWARSAQIALAKLAEAEEEAQRPDPFYQAKLQTARFYFTRLMPETSSLMRRIRAGSDVLMDTDAALA